MAPPPSPSPGAGGRAVRVLAAQGRRVVDHVVIVGLTATVIVGDLVYHGISAIHTLFSGWASDPRIQRASLPPPVEIPIQLLDAFDRQLRRFSGVIGHPIGTAESALRDLLDACVQRISSIGPSDSVRAYTMSVFRRGR
jgi:hypothetical protein